MENSTQFQEIFKELIEDLDYKKSEIPKRIGIDYDVFTKIMDYGRIPKPIILIRIADYFNVSIEYLLGRTNEIYFEKSTLSKSFYERYTELKNLYQLTDYAVAQKLHIATSYTSNWKKKGFIPSLTNLILLSEIFETTLDYLLGRTDYKN